MRRRQRKQRQNAKKTSRNSFIQPLVIAAWRSINTRRYLDFLGTRGRSFSCVQNWAKGLIRRSHVKYPCHSIHQQKLQARRLLSITAVCTYGSCAIKPLMIGSQKPRAKGQERTDDSDLSLRSRKKLTALSPCPQTLLLLSDNTRGPALRQRQCRSRNGQDRGGRE